MKMKKKSFLLLACQSFITYGTKNMKKSTTIKCYRHNMVTCNLMSCPACLLKMHDVKIYVRRNYFVLFYQVLSLRINTDLQVHANKFIKLT